MSSSNVLKRFLDEFPFTVIGHRGAAGLLPENTLPSFRLALELGAPMLELDVHRCDDRLIVIHDETLERTTDGRGDLSDLSYDAIRELDAGDGAPIPTLDEVLRLVETWTATAAVNIELKGADTAELVSRAVTASKVPLLVSSFDHDELRRFRALAADAAVAPLFSKWDDDCCRIGDELTAIALNWSDEITQPERVTMAKQHGFNVYVYTVNQQRRAEALREMGVDGVFTDRPDLLSEWTR